MTDLFTDLDAATTEVYEERAAIREYDGKQSRADAEAAARLEAEQFRHACEVREYARWTRDALVAQLQAIATNRGRAAAERIRDDVVALRRVSAARADAVCAAGN